MNPQSLSTTYRITALTPSDIPLILNLCSTNPQYYKYCPPAPTEKSIRRDMSALPKGKTLQDKFYLGFWKEQDFLAVMDLILKYPDDKTAFIGFFMVNANMQRNGIGSKIIEETCNYLKEEFSLIRLGYVKGNKQSENFWQKNSFQPTGVVTHVESYDVVIMQRTL